MSLRKSVVPALSLVLVISMTAAPAAQAGTAAPHVRIAAADTPPDVYPVPQQITGNAAAISLNGPVSLVVGADTDTPAITDATAILTAAGAGVTVVTAPATPPANQPAVYLGTSTDNPEIASVLDTLDVDPADGLATEGYVVSTGLAGTRPVAVLEGVDDAGTFYAVQTLRQLIVGDAGARKIAGVDIRDWPTMSIRGAIEGFYGPPWTEQARLDHFVFDGRQKMNTYIYSPKDDDYLRAKWQDAYPADKLADIKTLVDAATANHVKFVYALSPGLSICYSSATDLDKLIAKFQSLWDIGVRDFNIPFDDIDYAAQHCAGDTAAYGTGAAAAGKAQSALLNKVQQQFIKTHPGAGKLQTVPTEYTGHADSAYKTAIRTLLDPEIVIQWTGEAVVPGTITTADAQLTKNVFGHDIFLWDNYPVNDYASNRLLMGPLVGRDDTLGTVISGITSNPMVQSYASMTSLFNFGDYAWNPAKYDAPTSFAAGLRYLAGSDPEVRTALADFADLNWYWAGEPAHAPQFAAAAEKFWDAWTTGSDPAAVTDFGARVNTIAALPTLLAGMAQTGFAADAKPWIDAAGHYGVALKAGLAMLAALRAGDPAEAMAQRAAMNAARALTKVATAQNGTIVPLVGDGVLDTFLDRLDTAIGTWLGLGAPIYEWPQAITSMPQYQANAPARMVDKSLTTLYWSNKVPETGTDYVGVDLGSVKQVSKIEIHLGGSDADTGGDYFRHGKLEYSTDGKTWTALGDVTSTVATVTPAAPVGARILRVRANGTESTWIKVREFTVTATGGVPDVDPTISGTPAGTDGHGPAKAFDNRLETSYIGSAAPAAGDALTKVFDTPRAVALVDILGTATGEIQVKRDGSWSRVCDLGTGDFHECPIGGAPVDGVRLSFTAGSAAPNITEFVIRDLVDMPLTAAFNGRLAAGGTSTTVLLTNAGTSPVVGVPGFETPTGLTITASTTPVTVNRGETVAVPVTITGEAGRYPSTVTITPSSGPVLRVPIDIELFEPVSDVNVALSTNGGVASASSSYQASWDASHGNDGSLTSRWDSRETGADIDSEWFQVKLARSYSVGKVVIHWEASYAKRYKLQTSADGRIWTDAQVVDAGTGGTETWWIHEDNVRYVRMQGVARSNQYGYSLYEFEVYPTVKSLVDTVAPVVTLAADPAAPSGDNGWYTGPVTLTPTATDDRVESPPIEANIDGAGWKPVSEPILVTHEGPHTIAVRATDLDHNVSDVVTWTGKIDTVAPLTAPLVEEVDATTTSVTLVSSDVTSGVAKTEYRIGGGAFADYTGPIAVTRRNTPTTVEYRSTDAAGLVETTRSVVVPALPTVPLESTTTASANLGQVSTSKSVKVTVTVKAPSDLDDTTVTLTSGENIVGAGTLKGSGTERTAVVTVAGLPVGLHSLVAHFPGNAAVAPSESAAVKIEVYFADNGPTSPFFADVQWLVGAGITTGFDNGTFKPNASVERQAMAAFLYRYAHHGEDAPVCTAAPFPDVPVNNTFCGAISWLAGTGITTGNSDGKFHPADAVTRQAMAAFLYRFAHDGANPPACTAAPFPDVPANNTFCGAISWLAGTGITTGNSDGKFHPADAVSRQAMAAFLHRLDGLG